MATDATGCGYSSSDSGVNSWNTNSVVRESSTPKRSTALRHLVSSTLTYPMAARLRYRKAVARYRSRMISL